MQRNKAIEYESLNEICFLIAESHEQCLQGQAERGRLETAS